jgi:DNA polymerase-3 subunit alpha
MAKVKKADAYLRFLSERGLRHRYRDRGVKPVPTDAVDRLNFELDVIEKAGFATYFLIIADLCAFCRSTDIALGPGRGSVCGSLMAWAVGITDVNPLDHSIPFERFMHLERIAMPDIDMDLEHRRRPEVIAYLKEKYGENCVAQIMTFGNLTAKTALTDLCRVLHVDAVVFGNGMTNRYGKELADLVPEGSGPDQTMLAELIAEDPKFASMIRAPHLKFGGRPIDLEQHALDVEGMPRHTSKHAAGLIISADPLIDSLPLHITPNTDLRSQYDMWDLERLGFLKMDFLGLKTVTVLHDVEKLVGDLNLRQVPEDDRATFDLISRGDTVGVFQLEGAGITNAAMGVKPSSFSDIAALIALYHPGPMKQLGSFIARKHGEEPISYLHSDLKPILDTTYGLIIYQEQVMRIAQVFAGYTAGEADQFRKAIGKKIDKLIREQIEKFAERALERGYVKTLVEALCTQIYDFGRYGFNIGHSVGYGYITYWSAYCKAHYPKEFYTALLNSHSDNIESISTIIRDASRHGVRVVCPTINSAEAQFVCHPTANKIIFSLPGIKGVGEKAVTAIISERDRGGPFKNFQDFCTRVAGVPINVKVALIDAGSFVTSLEERAILLANAVGLNDEARGRRVKVQPSDIPTQWEMAERERAVTGFYLTAHPLKLRLPLLEMYDLDEEVQGTGSMAGVIHKINKFNSKRGEMAFVAIEALDPDCPDITIFAELWSKVKEHCKVGVLILFRYTKNNYRGRTSLVAETLHVVYNSTEHPASSVTIRLNEVNDEVGQELKDLVEEFSGESQLRLDVSWEEGKRGILKVREEGVRPTQGFIERAQRLGRVRLSV